MQDLSRPADLPKNLQCCDGMVWLPVQVPQGPPATAATSAAPRQRTTASPTTTPAASIAVRSVKTCIVLG